MSVLCTEGSEAVEWDDYAALLNDYPKLAEQSTIHFKG